jgi:hypothetical protein
MKKIGTDKEILNTIYKELDKKYPNLRSINIDTVKSVISRIEYDEDGDVKYKQGDITTLAGMLGNKNVVNVANDMSDIVLSSSLMEGVRRIKRRHTENHPAVDINPEAKMRNKIVEFIGGHDKCRCTKDELISFMNNLSEDEEIGKAPNKNYITSNKKLFSNLKIGNKEYIKLTEIGRRVLEVILKKEEKNMNESSTFGGMSKEDLTHFTNVLNSMKEETGYDVIISIDSLNMKVSFPDDISDEDQSAFMIDLGDRLMYEDSIKESLVVKYNGKEIGSYAENDNMELLSTMDEINDELNRGINGLPEIPKKNNRIGGIEFHAPLFNTSDAPIGESEEKIKLNIPAYESSKGYYGVVQATRGSKKLVEIFNSKKDMIYFGWIAETMIKQS